MREEYNKQRHGQKSNLVKYKSRRRHALTNDDSNDNGDSNKINCVVHDNGELICEPMPKFHTSTRAKNEYNIDVSCSKEGNSIPKCRVSVLSSANNDLNIVGFGMDCGITNGENLDCNVDAAFEPQKVKNRATIFNLSEFEVECWMNDHTPGKFTCVSEPIVQRVDSKYMGNWKVSCTKDHQEERSICTIGSNNARSGTVKLMKMDLQCDGLNNNPIICFSDVTLERFDNNDKAANIPMVLEKTQAFTDNIHIPVTTDPVLASKNFDRVLAIFKRTQVPTNTNTMILTCIMPLFVIAVFLTSIFWYFKKRSRLGVVQNQKSK